MAKDDEEHQSCYQAALLVAGCQIDTEPLIRMRCLGQYSTHLEDSLSSWYFLSLHMKTLWDGVNSFTEVRVCYMLSAHTLISSSKALELLVCDLLMLTAPDYLPVLQAGEAIMLM